MKISVVTISYNQAKFLREAMDSVLSQEGVDLEYIIVDPGSTDGSRDIILSYGDKITKIFERDEGPADGLNRGFAKANGDILYFLNSDDILLPGALRRASDLFHTTPESDVLLGAGVEVDADGYITRRHYPSRVSTQRYVNDAVTLLQQGMFFRREIFERVGGFNKNNKSCWDGELFFSFCLTNARVIRDFHSYGAFRMYPESISGSQRLRAIFDSDKNRMYQLVYMDESLALRKIRRIYYRFYKIVFDPAYTLRNCWGFLLTIRRKERLSKKLAL